MAKKQLGTKSATKNQATGSAPARTSQPRTGHAGKHSKAAAVVINESAIDHTAPAKPAPAERDRGETVAKLAYGYWAARGFQGGHPDEDWARAEREFETL